MKHRIKQLRTKILHMKQRDFSAKTGIAPQQLSNYESRGVTPSFAVIEKIAKAFNVNPAWLVGWSNDISNPDLDTRIIEKVVVEKVVHIQPPPYWQCDEQGKLVQWKQTRRPYIGQNWRYHAD